MIIDSFRYNIKNEKIYHRIDRIHSFIFVHTALIASIMIYLDNYILSCKFMTQVKAHLRRATLALFDAVNNLPRE